MPIRAFAAAVRRSAAAISGRRCSSTDGTPVGIAGSTSTGDYVVMAGQAGIRDHVHIGDRAVLSEAVALAGFSEAEVSKVLGIKAKPLADHPLVAVTSGEAERQFLAAFEQLDLAFRLERGT